jgi:hypothetical protein
MILEREREEGDCDLPRRLIVSIGSLVKYVLCFLAFSRLIYTCVTGNCEASATLSTLGLA